MLGSWIQSLTQPKQAPEADQKPNAAGGWLQQLAAPFQQAFLNPNGLSDDDYEQLEELLIRADMGVDLAMRLCEKLRKQSPKTLEVFQQAIAAQLQGVLNTVADKTALKFQPKQLNVYMVLGVNGVGKTTLIAKLAHQFKTEGNRVLVAAGDTFRAAAVEQLQVWAERAGADVVQVEKGTAAAVAYQALEKAKAENYDVLIIDTAGRLQNKYNLMEELKKIADVVTAQSPQGSWQETLLVVDATTGQNALQQAKLFSEVTPVTGVAITKVDGSGKGGVACSIVDELKLPIKLIGTGEKLQDIEPFSAERFVNQLLDKSY